jgi:glycosyltransferase involved in cell wall biosynthesis
VRVLIFGGIDPDYARNQVLRVGLARLGVAVELCAAPAWRSAASRYALLLARYLRRAPSQAILVPEFRHKDVPLARLLATLSGSALVVDPLISRYDTRVHDWGSVQAGSLRADHSRRVDRAAVRFADLLLCDTPAHARYFAANYRVPADRCAVVPVGFDDALFRPLPEPCEHPFRVAFYGSYLPLHGTDTIVAAARRLVPHGVRVLLIGGGQTFESVRRARAEGVPLEVSPPLPAADLVQRLRTAHVLLGIFGTTDKAARVVPNKIYQGLGLARALVTADTPAVRDFFVSGEHLWTVPAGDPEALADAVLRLRAEPALRRRLAAQGARFVHSRFNPEAVARSFLEAGERVFAWPAAG